MLRRRNRPDAGPGLPPCPAPPALLWRRDWLVHTSAPDRRGSRPS